MSDTTRLRELLRELADSTDDLLNTMLNSRTYAQRERVSNALSVARAALAAEPVGHVHTKSCYTDVPETEGTGQYLSCRLTSGAVEPVSGPDLHPSGHWLYGTCDGSKNPRPGPGPTVHTGPHVQMDDCKNWISLQAAPAAAVEQDGNQQV